MRPQPSSLLSPLIAFPALWCAAVLFAQLRLFEIQEPWSAAAWAVVIAVPLAFVVGGVLGDSLVSRWLPHAAGAVKDRIRTSPRMRKVLVACVAIGYLELAHQFAAGSGVPLLAPEADVARTDVPGGPTIILTNFLAVAVIVAICLPERLTAPESRFELAVIAAGVIGHLLNANRSAIALALVSGFLARFIYRGFPSWRSIILGGTTLLLLFMAVFYFRASQHTGNPFEAELYGQVVPETPFLLRPLVPAYIALTANLDALARIVDYFPDQAGFGHGAYSARGIDLFVTSAKDLSPLSGMLTPPWTTTTVAGSLWADGGFPIVILGVALIGFASTAAFTYARRSHALLPAMLAGLFLYQALIGIYQNLWTQHVDWVMIAFLLVPMAALARDPTWPSGLRGPPRPGEPAGWRRYPARMTGAASKKPAEAARKRAPRSTEADVRTRGLWGRIWSRPALVAMIAGGALLLAAIVLEITRPKEIIDPVGEIRVAQTLEFPPGGAPPVGAGLATDGDVPVDNLPLWVVRQRGPQAAVRGYAFPASGGLDASAVVEVPLGSAGPHGFDVAEGPNGSVLYTVSQEASGARVEGFDLLEDADEATGSPGELSVSSAPRRRFGGVAPIPPHDSRLHREFHVATLSGDSPDLYVIDRGIPNDRPTITVFSGESSFREEIASFKVPVLGLDPDDWYVDVARFEGTEPDLVMTLRSGETDGPEMHVLSGESDFEGFLAQRAIGLEDGLPGGLRVALGNSYGVATLYATDVLDPKAGLDLLPLRARPGVD